MDWSGLDVEKMDPTLVGTRRTHRDLCLPIWTGASRELVEVHSTTHVTDATKRDKT